MVPSNLLKARSVKDDSLGSQARQISSKHSK